MDDRTIYITDYDLKRLRELLDETRRKEGRLNGYMENLDLELARGITVAPTLVPPDVITMNSRVLLVDQDTQEEMEFTLVFPQDADIAEGKISILAPVGTAMLGYRAGDIFSWKVPDGVRRLLITRVPYQPEAAGDYHL